MSELRVKLASVDHCKQFSEEKWRQMESELIALKTRIIEKETEIITLRLTLAKIVVSTGHQLSENELHLLKGMSYSSDLLIKKIIDDDKVTEKPPVVPSRSSMNFSLTRDSRRDSVGSYQIPSSSSAYHVPLTPPRGRSASPMLRTTSVDEVNYKTSTPNYSKSPTYSSTLPRLHGNRMLSTLNDIQGNSETNGQLVSPDSAVDSCSLSSSFGPSKDKPRPISMSSTSAVLSNSKLSVVTFGKFSWLKQGKRCKSAPDLAKEDQIIKPKYQQSNPDLPKSSLSLPPGTNPLKDVKSKGLRKFFGKMRRSDSGSGNNPSEFVRGGFRSTAPRLGQSNDKKSININLPFSRWDTNLIAEWFGVIGLGMYTNDCKRWVKNGEHILRATANEIEKDLGIKNSLHRKKLRLALAVVDENCDNQTKAASKLDYLWVARWLDDIGLPQYKENFIEARIDGSTLNHMTIEDLIALKVTLNLHHASVRYGIKVLRSHKFDPFCLKRRAGPDEVNINQWIPAEIALWTCHRVMEWLRSIDLSEYAPNLRGSGVHGALMVNEKAFNSDLLATLLSIPHSKTLLRRHITTHFRQLIGHEIISDKRRFESQSNYVPLSPFTKVKCPRKSQFSLLKKKSKFEMDYVCPLNTLTHEENSLNEEEDDEKVVKETTAGAKTTKTTFV